MSRHRDIGTELVFRVSPLRVGAAFIQGMRLVGFGYPRYRWPEVSVDLSDSGLAIEVFCSGGDCRPPHHPNPEPQVLLLPPQIVSVGTYRCWRV